MIGDDFMRTRTLMMALLLVVVLAPAVGSPAVAKLQGDYASVDISPTYQEIASGGVATFTVVASSSAGGTVVVSVPAGLDLLGSPTCSSGCRVPMVSDGVDDTSIEFNIDGQIATLNFSATVSPTVAVGTSLYVGAFLVGGPQAVEQTSATIVVTGATSGQSPSLDDNRFLYLDASPLALRMTSEGQFLYYLQPIRWGMWEGQPNYTVDIQLPPELLPVSDPRCGGSSAGSTQSPCQGETETNDDGSTSYTIQPGYSGDGSTHRISLTIQLSSEAQPGSSLQIAASMDVQDESLPEQPLPAITDILVVDEQSLTTSESPNTVNALIEVRSGLTPSASDCTDETFENLALFEWGLESILATTAAGPGMVGEATDGSGDSVCHYIVEFLDVPRRDMYVLVRDPDPIIGACRACVLGLLTETTGGAQVIVLSYG